MAGCSDCDRIAPSPAEMHSEGWLIVADENGLVSITCPAHRKPADTLADGLPDYLERPGDRS